MKKFSASWLSLAVVLLAASGLATAATHYIVANDDSAFPIFTGVSLFAVGANGLPVFQQRINTGQFGIAGGYFGMNRIAALDQPSQQCIFASESANGDIVEISVSTFTVSGKATGSKSDAGTSNGIGLALNTNYLYASFSDSNTIATFRVQSGCGLAFIGDTSVTGLLGGGIDGMAVHGTMLIASYTDGSIESFDVSSGTPLSNGDKQLSTATVNSHGATYANSIDITSDGHFAIFGDTSASLSVEVSDISSGKLAKTSVYQSSKSISSSNVMLSPDETLIYVINTQGATVSALFFDKTTGKLTTGCTSRRLVGQSQNYSYLASMALINQTGNGGGVYVAEFGNSSAIATVALTVSGTTCSLAEVAGSPAFDQNTTGLLSITAFPPRSF